MVFTIPVTVKTNSLDSNFLVPPMAKNDSSLFQPTKTGRSAWIDTAKGIGILLVLTGHLPLPTLWVKEIHSFNMPCFFFFAGLVFKPKYDFQLFIQNKATHLLKPYFVFSVLSFISWFFIRPLSNTMQQAELWPTFASIFYGSNTSGIYMAHNMPLWFLPCLFISMMLFYGLTKLPRAWHIAAAIILAGVSWALSTNTHSLPFRLPWSIDTALMAVAIMSIGYLCPTMVKVAHNLRWYHCLALIALNVTACFSNGLVDMNYNRYGNIALFALSALSGIMVICKLSFWLDTFPAISKKLSYIGKNSLYILCCHNVVFVILSGLLHKALLHIPDFNTTFDNPNMFNGFKVVVLAGYIGIALWFSRKVKQFKNIFAKTQST